MRKLSIIIILLSCISTLGFSQQKTEFGVMTEGSWFMPNREPEYLGHATRNGFGTGIGVYASHNLFWRFATDIGLTYRYKQMQQQYEINSETNSDGFGVPNWQWDKLPMHYVVVPIHLQLLLSKNLFVKGGIESNWLLNYDVVNEKPEFNWVVGFGSQKHKLKWSVNYIRGFKEQGFGDKTAKPDGHYKASINRNNMLQLQLSYPIGQLKF